MRRPQISSARACQHAAHPQDGAQSLPARVHGSRFQRMPLRQALQTLHAHPQPEPGSDDLPPNKHGRGHGKQKPSRGEPDEGREVYCPSPYSPKDLRSYTADSERSAIGSKSRATCLVDNTMRYPRIWSHTTACLITHNGAKRDGL